MNNTLIKGLHLLETLARRGQPMGLTELAKASGLCKSGAHRLLQALVDEHYVQRQESGSYAAAIKLWELGSAALVGFDLRRHADGVMESLMQRTGETVHLSVLDQREVVYVHKVDGPNPVRAYSQIGGRAASHCVATGKAMMAFKSSNWLADATLHLSAATPRTVTDPEGFKSQMERVRKVGYAINLGEWRLSINGLAAPIFDGTGSVIAAIGISGPDSRLKPGRLRSLADAVRASAQALSADLSKAAPHASLLGVTSNWVRLM